MGDADTIVLPDGTEVHRHELLESLARGMAHCAAPAAASAAALERPQLVGVNVTGSEASE